VARRGREVDFLLAELGRVVDTGRAALYEAGHLTLTLDAVARRLTSRR